MKSLPQTERSMSETYDPVVILGAGSWGTALAISLALAGRRPILWTRRPEVAEYMQVNRRNPRYLSHIPLPASIYITSDLEEAATAARTWTFAVPSHALREVARQVQDFVSEKLLVISAAKGLEIATLKTSSQVLEEVLSSLPPERIGVLYGPSHAEEVALGKPTAIVAASRCEQTAEQIQTTYMSERLRVYVNTDLIGVEIGGSVKNVIAIASGISDGAQFGDNAKAALITRGIAEIARLGILLGARPLTFAGLAGIGDLVATCTSRHSRNRYVGEQIARGRKLQEILDEMKMVAEGVRTTRAVCKLARKYGIEMPISEGVYRVLFEDLDPVQGVRELMTRTPKREDWLAGLGEASAPSA